MSSGAEDSSGDNVGTDSIKDWVDVNPAETIVLLGLGGAAVAWSSLKGIELAANIDFSLSTELRGTALGASVGALICAVTLRKIFGSG